MHIEWKDNSATVGRLELCVWRSDFTGKWNTRVLLGLNQIGSHHEFESATAARAWCEREVLSIVGPLLDAARADGAAAEREACVFELEEDARRLDGVAAECTGSVFGRSCEAQAETLRGAIDAIRARSNTPT